MKNFVALLSLIVSACAGTIPCFYNTAYEENNFLDKPDYALHTANNCYVLIDADGFNDLQSVVNYTNALKINNNTIGCYMSVGTVEDWRPDFQDFVSGTDYQSEQWPEWPGEYMIKANDDGDVTDNTIALMKKRIDVLANVGCEYIEMDNMDIDGSNKLTNIKGAAMRAYNKELCKYMHSCELKCMAKNTGPSDSDYELFDGLSTESYPKEMNWWGTKHALNFKDKPFMISHYKEKTVDDCMGVWAEYGSIYNETVFGFICSQYETKHYIHFGFIIED